MTSASALFGGCSNFDINNHHVLVDQPLYSGLASPDTGYVDSSLVENSVSRVDPADIDMRGEESRRGMGPRASTIAFESVLETYEGYEEEKKPAWVRANERVGEVGGWRTYAREMFEMEVDSGDKQ